MIKLDELERLSKAATVGPWTFEEEHVYSDHCGHVAESSFQDIDAELIAAMRNNIDALIEVARAAQNYFTESDINLNPKYFKSYHAVKTALAELECGE